MFNIFKRDKSVENNDPQPAADLNPATPDQEETTEPLNPIETPEETPVAQPIDVSSSPTAEEPRSQTVEAVESPQPAGKDETREASLVTPPPVKTETSARATVPDLTSLKRISHPAKAWPITCSALKLAWGALCARCCAG